MSRHRATPVRPRYGRIAALGASLAATVVAVLGGTGVISASGADRLGATAVAETAAAPAAPAGGGAGSAGSDGDVAARRLPAAPSAALAQDAVGDPSADPTLPTGSGHGRRVVFSEGRQRVWLVAADGTVRRTYRVSGSLTDNLHPGTYAVYSRSEQAYGIDDSGTMRYFVRFTRGENAAIGFHDIPVLDGRRVQTRAQLGTPQSHGCIRQWRPDAIALWRFAPIGTTVVVTA